MHSGSVDGQQLAPAIRHHADIKQMPIQVVLMEEIDSK
jgi:hypothetical protein